MLNSTKGLVYESVRFNQALSLARATQVAAYLKTRLKTSVTVHVVGKGITSVSSTLARDRKVVITVA